MPIDETKNKRLVIVVSQETAKTIEQLAKKDRRPVCLHTSGTFSKITAKQPR